MTNRVIVAQVLLLLSVQNAYAQKRVRETTIDVKAVDYALMLPDTIAAGTHRWTLTNTGSSRHEMIVSKLGANADAQVAIDSLHARGMRALFPGNPDIAVASSALLAAPSKKSDAELVTHDRRGDRLLVFCQLRDADGKPRHDELGMFKLVYVR